MASSSDLSVAPSPNGLPHHQEHYLAKVYQFWVSYWAYMTPGPRLRMGGTLGGAGRGLTVGSHGQAPRTSQWSVPLHILPRFTHDDHGLGHRPPDGNATRMGAGFLTAGDGARSRRSLRPDLFSPIRFTTRSCTHLLAPHRGRSSGVVLGAWSPSGCMPQLGFISKVVCIGRLVGSWCGGKLCIPTR